MRLPSALGPLFYEELKRLGRRGSVPMLRTAMATALLLAVVVGHPGDDVRLPLARYAAVAQSIFYGIMVAQVAAVYFLTPLFAAAVLTEEREKKTLELLLTTTLTAREIAAGKLLARVVFVGGVILAGMPIVAMLPLFGGISPRAIVLAYTALFANLWGLAGMTAAIAAGMPSYRAALYTSWVAAGLFLLCPLSGPLYFLGMAGGVFPDAIVWLVITTGLNVAVGFGGLIIAVRSVRPWESSAAQTVKVREPQKPAVVVPRRYVEDARVKPAGIAADFDWANPPGQREGPTPTELTVGGFLFGIGLGLTFGLGAFEPPEWHRDWPAVMALGWIPAGLFAAVRAAGTISREREADTLTALLTAPPGRTELLWRKYRKALDAPLILCGLTAFIGLLVFLANGLDWYPGFLALGLVFVPAAASLGLVLTVGSRTTFVAQAGAVLGVLLMGALPAWMLAVTGRGGGPGSVPAYYLLLGGVAVAGWLLAVRTFWGYAKK